MSTTFGHYGGAEQVPRQWFAAFFTSTVVYVALGLAVTVLGVGTKKIVTERPVDVTFVEKVVKEEPPPPPPTPVEIKKEPPPPPAPVIPKDMKVRVLEAPPPPKELVAPAEMPQEKPEEADPSQDKGIAVYGNAGEGDPAGLEGGVTTGGEAGGKVGAPLSLPEGAVPPKSARGNSPPAYPVTARKSGQTGSVTLKIVVTADGRVTDVEVVEGEEPFITAAIEAVKHWKYEPARFNGKPITVYHTIKVGFRLNG